MVFFEGEAKDSRQMRIDTIKTDCAPPSSHRRVNLNVEVRWVRRQKSLLIPQAVTSKLSKYANVYQSYYEV